MRDSALILVEKALNLWIEDMIRKRIPINGTVLRLKALTIYEELKDSRDDIKTFIASRGWWYDLKKGSI